MVFDPATVTGNGLTTTHLTLAAASGGATTVFASPYTNGFNTIEGGGNTNVTVAGGPAGYATVALGNGTDKITLSGADNTVVTGNGNDTVTGAPGGQTTVTLGNGNNSVYIGGKDDIITLGNGTNTVLGTQGMAFISTGSGKDTITVAGSGNTISAGGGTNVINAVDAGSDRFVMPVASQGFDTITGFLESNGDVLDLRAALAATSWNGSATKLANYLKVTDSGGNTNLAIAAKGTGAEPRSQH